MVVLPGRPVVSRHICVPFYAGLRQQVTFPHTSLSVSSIFGHRYSYEGRTRILVRSLTLLELWTQRKRKVSVLCSTFSSYTLNTLHTCAHLPKHRLQCQFVHLLLLLLEARYTTIFHKVHVHFKPELYTKILGLIRPPHNIVGPPHIVVQAVGHTLGKVWSKD